MNTQSNFINIFIFLLCISLPGRCLTSSMWNVNEVNNHLNLYSKVNQSHHDNIDDQPHVHTHKHSEEGEEHEHHHEHNKFNNNELKLSHFVEYFIISTFVEYSKNNFFEKNHFSNSYSEELFRPPIS